MSDLIDRQSAIDALNEYFARIGKLKRRGLTKGEKAISLDTVGTIKTLSPIQPKRGRWIPVTNGRSGHECDQCHNYAPSYQTGEEHLSDFCPNCGADMREVTSGDEER